MVVVVGVVIVHVMMVVMTASAVRLFLLMTVFLSPISSSHFTARATKNKTEGKKKLLEMLGCKIACFCVFSFLFPYLKIVIIYSFVFPRVFLRLSFIIIVFYSIHNFYILCCYSVVSD